MEVLFLQMNLSLKFSADKNRSFVCRLPSEAGASFNFQLHVQDGSDPISVWGMMMAKGVVPLVFYDE